MDCTIVAGVNPIWVPGARDAGAAATGLAAGFALGMATRRNSRIDDSQMFEAENFSSLSWIMATDSTTNPPNDV